MDWKSANEVRILSAVERLAKTIFFGAWVIICLPLYGSHLVGGEISYKQTGPLTFEVSIAVYTESDAPVLPGQGAVDFGDGSGSLKLDSLAESQGQEIFSEKVPGSGVSLNRFTVGAYILWCTHICSELLRSRPE